MKLTFGDWCFNPKILSSLLTLVFMCLFISLGVWQLNRAEYKRDLHAEFKAQLAAPEIDFKKAYDEERTEELIWRRAIITGRFIENKQVLLDNQVMSGEPGYFVYTPLQIDGLDKWLLVNRGWIAVGRDRMSAPLLNRINLEVSINGVVKEVPKTGLLLKETPPEKMTDEIYRVQKIDLKELETAFDNKLLPIILRLEPESDHGYVREWQLPGSGEIVHKGYAYQWFAFAVTLLIIYLVLNIKRVD